MITPDGSASAAEIWPKTRNLKFACDLEAELLLILTVKEADSQVCCLMFFETFLFFIYRFD